MCGIAGFFGFKPQNPTAILDQFIKDLNHRGPDGNGKLIKDHFGLAHTRLSIIDLTEGGHQPMTAGENHLTYNGEIYNYQELKNDLKQHTFQSTSDTEVLLTLLKTVPIEKALPKLDGMFAFAYVNENNKELILARDRFGEKPLFYYWDKSKFIFTSELASLKNCSEIKIRINEEAKTLYWKYGYIPTPLTIYQNIFKLPAGSFLKISHRTLKIQQYWELTHSKEKYHTPDELNEKIKESVHSRLVSDTPVGVFLSGGLDSSLLTKLISEEIQQPKAFSIGMPDKSYDESYYAKQVAKTIKLEHILEYPELDISKDMERVVKSFGEPFGDSSAIPYFYLSKMASQHVKVAIGGDGADELFGGYYRYQAQIIMQTAKKIPAILRNSFIKLLTLFYKEKQGFYGNSPLKKAILFNKRLNLWIKDPTNIVPIQFNDDEIKQMSQEYMTPSSDPIKEKIAYYSEHEGPKQMMLTDIATYLESDILTKADRMSMANSLEVRCPYLDPKIAELAVQLPLEEKVTPKESKIALKKVGEKHLSKEIFSRKKQGFGLPIHHWLANQLKEEMLQMIDDCEKNNLKKAYFQKLWQEQMNNHADHSQKLWQFYFFQKWHEYQ